VLHLEVAPSLNILPSRAADPQVQVATFLVFAGFRAFLYGVMGAYIGDTFGPLTLGRITGCVFTTGSLVNLLQAPIIDSTNFYFGGNTDVLAAGMALLGLFTFLVIRFAAANAESAKPPAAVEVNTVRGAMV
jgi:hypothetical protein